MGLDDVVLGPVRRWLDSVPRWVRAFLAVVAIVLGAAILLRPTTSLGVLAWLLGAGLVVLGAVELLTHPSDDGTPSGPWRTARRVVAVLMIAAGVFVLVFPGLTVRLIAVIVGTGLIVNGATSVAAAFRRQQSLDARVASAAFGVTGVVFGVLALAWPDITLLVVSVVFGARLIMAGAVLAWSLVAGARTREPGKTPGPARRWTRAGAALVSVGLAAVAAVASATLHSGSPVVDAFYAAPRDVPGQPGQLVRSEPFTRQVPAGARAWRILYTTTRGDGSPAVASGLVVVPASGAGSWPVIDWDHGTTGFAQSCAPSLAAQPFESGALMVLPQIIEQGWALVATDYIGLGTQAPHPYLIGPDTAHASLDAIRAARQLHQADLSDQTVVWGHSQGGGAALWTGALAHEYAPDLKLDGVAALAPASNLPALVANLPHVTGGSVFASYVLAAYAATYPDVSERAYLRPGATVTVDRMSQRCLAPPGVLASVLTALALSRDPEIFAEDPTTGALGRRLAQNVPPPTISAPLLIAQGAADKLVIPAAQQDYVNRLCAAGQQVDYRTYAGRDHVPLVEPDSPLIPQLVTWTHDRLDHKPIQQGCTHSAH